MHEELSTELAPRGSNSLVTRACASISSSLQFQSSRSRNNYFENVAKRFVHFIKWKKTMYKIIILFNDKFDLVVFNDKYRVNELGQRL